MDTKFDVANESSVIATYTTQGCLVFPVQTELSKETAMDIQAKLLEQVHSKNYLGVVIDLSGIEIIDSVLWKILSNTSVMINVLGFKTVMTGLSPGVVASIIDVNLELSKIITAMTIQDALDILVSLNNVSK
ncbi:STAS domain-containing protein [Marinomonas sp. PE14-40]|uniref:STAS domain-containing protein n=1 Tax=Marinomonas sp. PE14-40 TaxID=3060621 RepID=UPI003F66A8E0